MGVGTSKIDKSLADLPENERYFGFENYGNTCYGNSVLQALYFCLPFRESLISHYINSKGSEKGDEETLLSCLCELFYNISTQRKRSGVMGPKKFINKLKKENELFRGFVQQDAHEFLNYTLNEIAEILEKREAAKEKKSETAKPKEDTNSKGGKTAVHKMFEGILTNETKCLTCETKTSKDESFLDLSLDIEQNTSLTHCLRSFGAIEMLSGQDKFYCDVCHSKQEAEKGIKIKKLPPILVLHLKRFKYIEQVQSYKKLFYRVVFPFELRLQCTTEDAVDAERLYKLFAIVIHIGSGPNQGHYVCIIKSQNHWIQFDDENVDEIEEENIRQFFGSTNEMMQE
eukprot:TRINITY_DN8623_c0_g1_i1.p1 TRINITY_DN8623_c0_g1~~TRINITY_DN8623_c0_g1_i1.p1  ORF type:complete len:343 (-),score=70.53 TRINITY_DN8623_c0_g1_i1:56-1084(-)